MPLWWWWISSLRWCILSLPLPPVLQKLLQSCIETMSLSYMVFLTRSSVIVTSDLLVLSSLGSALWWGARQAMSTPFHPETDGQTERVNRVLEDMLRHYVSPVQDDWDQHLACAEFAINNADHRSTGTSPFMLNYGCNPRIPFSIERKSKSPAANDFAESMQRRITEARILHRTATQRQKLYAEKGRKDVQFQKDQWVLLSSKKPALQDGHSKAASPLGRPLPST